MSNGESTDTQPRSGFGFLGLVLLIAGIGLALFAFFIYDPSVAPGDGFGSDRINNLGLMQRQAMMFYAGCAAAVTGILSLGIGAILERLAR